MLFPRWSMCKSQVEHRLQMDRLCSLHNNFPHLQQLLQLFSFCLCKAHTASCPHIYRWERGLQQPPADLRLFLQRLMSGLLNVWAHHHLSFLFKVEPPPVRSLLLPGRLHWRPQYQKITYTLEENRRVRVDKCVCDWCVTAPSLSRLTSAGMPAALPENTCSLPA